MKIKALELRNAELYMVREVERGLREAFRCKGFSLVVYGV
jgi:hypothetical protein